MVRIDLRGDSNQGGIKLLRLFTSFPDGTHGAALLFLRAVLGITAFIEGGHHLVEKGHDFTIWSLATDALYLVCGAALLIGFLTPVFSVLFCLGVVFSLRIMPSTGDCNHLWCNLPGIYAVVISIALTIFGPGAFSLDARLFGRHEIIIPDDFPETEA